MTVAQAKNPRAEISQLIEPNALDYALNQKFENGRLSEENRGLKLRNDSIESTTHLRELYAILVAGYLGNWTIVMFGILIINWLSLWKFSLSDAVLSTLVGGTTVSAIGLVLGVVHGLFPSNKKKE